jgi:hypothetical protein
MDILSFGLAFLTVLFIGGIIALNTMRSVTTVQTNQNPKVKQTKEGFEVSSVANQVRAVLDPMVAGAEDICSIYKTIRQNIGKNEKVGQSISDAEVNIRVEKALALKIPGGALQCSSQGTLLHYPKEGSTDLDWLDFVQKLPSDFGARVVFMALYARDSLKETAQGMKDALAGKGAPQTQEGFSSICPPDVAQTRRLEKQKQLEAGCTLPEDLGPDQIKEQITKRLEKLVAERTSILKAKDIDPLIKIKPILDEAKVNQAYLEKTGKQAEEGTLEVNIPQ